MARVNGVAPPAPKVNGTAKLTPNETKPSNGFDWSACVDGFTDADALSLILQRRYSRDFCRWLRENGLIGKYNDCIAFPVHDRAGKVAACHYRAKNGKDWFYYPTGRNTRPLVIGELHSGETVHVFESQWDAFALMDKSGERSGIIITRGAQNGKLIAGLVPAGATVYAWKQNDELKNGTRAGDEWLKDVAGHAGAKVVWPKTPEQFKDLNDWTRAGAAADDLLAAMMNAEVIREAGDLNGESTTSSGKTQLQPFPLGCLPRICEASARTPLISECGMEHASVVLKLPPENDAGNARLLIDLFGDELRFVHAFDSWLIWDGTRWRRDEDGGIQRLALQLSQRMLSEAAKLADHKQRTAVAERAIRLGNAAKIKSMLDLAKCDSSVVIAPSALDANPWLLGVENGVIELRTGTFRSGRKNDLITKSAGCAYDPNAKALRWRQFLLEIFADNKELIDYVQKLVGYTLTGSTLEQLFVFLHGGGANGKTTFIETLTALLGDYAQRAPHTLLVACDNGREPMHEIARLHGARFVVSSETGEGDRLAENRIKDMTGGDTLTGRFLYREPFDFSPVLKLWMFGNYRPEIRGTDRGIWRRVRLIPFNVEIAKNKRERHLQDKLREELPGILAWAVEGCLSWQRDGLTLPAAVTAATAEYREEEDVLRDFLRDETERDDGNHVRHSELYARYKTWCERNGVRFPMQSRTLSKRLSGRGYKHERTGEGIRWGGIRLK
jgi:P4 family phage/plasmid primase-like protien